MKPDTTRHLLFVAFAALCLQCGAEPTNAADEAPQLRSAPLEAIICDGGTPRIVPPSAVPSLKLDWTERRHHPVPTPVVAAGKVYAASVGGDLTAFDHLTGEVVWSVSEPSAQGASSAAVAYGQAYIAFRNEFVYSFAAATGAPRWKGRASERILTTPLVAEGVVYVTSVDGTLSAFEAAGCGAAVCEPLWTAATTTLPSTPAFGYGSIFVAASDGWVYAFAANGCGQAQCAPRAKLPLIGPRHGDPIVSSRRLFVVSSGSHTELTAWDVVRLSETSTPPGAMLHIALGAGTEPTTPAMEGGLVYVPVRTDTSGELHAYNATTGELRWRAPIGDEDPSMSTPTAADGVVYIAGNTTHEVLAFSRGCGKGVSGTECSPIARFGSDAWMGSSAIIADQRLYFGGYAGIVQAWQLP